MIKTRSRIALLLMLLFTATPHLAFAVEIPVLTWERGRVQEVILGDTSTGTDWKIELISKNTDPILFTRSTQNDSGFVVYSAVIPDDFPEGGYSLESSGGGTVRTIVAGVNIIAAATYDIRTKTVDLALVVALFTLITVTLSVLRSRKYSMLATIPTPLDDEPTPAGLIEKLLSRVKNLRRDLTQGVAPSLFRHLLGQESAFLYKSSKALYFFMPIFAVIFGGFAAINAQASEGLENSSLIFFFAITVIGLIDSFSGIFGLFAFWLVQFFYGDVSNVNQILVMVAAAIAWIGPSLMAAIYQDAIRRDFEKIKGGGALAAIIAPLGSALAATALFYGGYKLLLSLLGELSTSFQMQPAYIATVFVVAFTKAVLVNKSIRDVELINRDEFEVVRVVSPQVALSAFAIVFGFAFIWTDSAFNAVIAATLFSLPYFFLFLRFEPIGVKFFGTVKRNILAESGLSVLASILIYTQVQRLPQLSGERAEIFLIAAAIPGLLHAIYSSICDSAQRQETIET